MIEDQFGKILERLVHIDDRIDRIENLLHRAVSFYQQMSGNFPVGSQTDDAQDINQYLAVELPPTFTRPSGYLGPPGPTGDSGVRSQEPEPSGTLTPSEVIEPPSGTGTL